ncbi:MAG: hypothetical protein GY761_16335 [Hyphomicrobiales bacterium]|nr:hypothetical protein [Hyphomicrobiales bacterium]
MPAGVAVAAYIQPFVKPRLLFLDPLVAAVETESCCQTYLGIVSTLGIILWVATASVCLFAAYLMFMQKAPRAFVEFALLAGLLSTWLAFDDVFLVHDNLAPKLGVPQNLVLFSIALAAILYCLRCWRVIVRSDAVMFGLATGCLGMSVLIDVFHFSTDHWPFLVDSGRTFIEDGFKFIGLFCWSVFHVMAVARLCDSNITAPDFTDLSLIGSDQSSTLTTNVNGAKRFEGQSVLLLGNYRPTLFIARQLKHQGARVISGLEGCDLGAEYSRYVDETWDHCPVEQDPKAFIRALEQYVRSRKDISIILPVSEEFCRAIANHKPDLPDTIIVAMNDAELVKTCLDKTRMLDLCSAIGVPVAPYVLVDNADDLQRAETDIGFPMVARPSISASRINREKAVRIKNSTDLSQLHANWNENWGGLIVQKQVSGLRNNIFFAARNGEVCRLLQTKILRTDRFDGSGLAVEGMTVEPDARLVRYTEALAKKLDYSGIGCAQFLVDDVTGEVCFLENNPRFSGSHVISEYCGLDLIGFQIALAQCTLEQQESRQQGVVGVRYGWMSGDLNGLRHAVRGGKIDATGAVNWFFKALRNGFTSDVDMVLRWDDPLPGLVSMFETLPYALRLTRRKSWKPGT